LVEAEVVHLHQVVHLLQLLILEKKDLTHLLLDTLLQVEEKADTAPVVMAALEVVILVQVMKVDLIRLKELTVHLMLKFGVTVAAEAEETLVKLELLQVEALILMVHLEVKEDQVALVLIMDHIFLV
jgi:hypothetical protein